MHGGPPEALICRLDDLGNVAYLAVSGEVNPDNARILRAHLQMAAQGRQNTIVLDFSDLRHLDSSGVEVLLEGQRKLAYHGQMIVLVAPSASIRKVLSVLRLEDVMPVFVSVKEALTYLEALSGSEEQSIAGS